MLMSRSIRWFALVALLFASALASRPTTAADSSLIPNQYIVVLKDTTADVPAVSQQLAALYGLTIQHTYSHALKGFSATVPSGALTLLKANPLVEFVQQDRVVQIDAQPLPTGINRIDTELSPTANINGADDRVNVDVAVIDTGIDMRHPDLNVVGGKNCVLSLLSPNDDHGHGSHVAGTIGAKDNDIGVVGVAPGARLWAVKVLSGAGTGTTSQVICGIDYVAQNAGKIKVANMSLGGAGQDYGNCGNGQDAQHKAICNAVSRGVTFVVAAGNDTADAAGFTPAAYNEVITVSALADFNGLAGGGAASTCRSDRDDTFASFSNYGADVDIIAPGVCIYSTSMMGGYATLSGTSMASPHVAGAAALYVAKNPGATPAQVRQALIQAGTASWDNSDDGDSIKEPLLNVSGF